MCHAAALAGVSDSLWAQEHAYPNKQVRFILPSPPGGGVDFIGRIIAQKLTDRWGQSLVIDNRSGAGGIIGVDLTAKAPPDGYTMVMGHPAPIAVSVSLIKLPYDPIADLAPITLLAVAQNILVVHPSLPAASVKQLIEVLKSRPRHYNYGSAGNGTSPHLSAELFKIMTDTSMNHVPYKGAGPLLIDLATGEISVYFGSIPSTMPHVKTKKLRALAVTGERRSQLAPELPTIAETGVPDFESTQWYGVLVPAKTRVAITDKLNRDFVSAINSPEVKDKLLTQGYELVGNSKAEFGNYIESEIAKWAQVVKKAGIRAD